jgi:hypothetical protein
MGHISHIGQICILVLIINVFTFLFFIPYFSFSDCDRCFDRRMALIIFQCKISKLKIKNIFYILI